MDTRTPEENMLNGTQGYNGPEADVFYDKYASVLFKIICCNINEAQLAEDVLEQTFCEIWASADQNISCLWMAGIARKNAKAANVKRYTEVLTIKDNTEDPPSIFPALNFSPE